MFKRVVIVVAFVVLVGFLGWALFHVNEQDDNEIYAQSIVVDKVPREIELVLGNSLIFDYDPYTLLPVDCNQTVEIDILNHLSKPIDTATYSNRIFTASKVASYYIKFKVKNKYGNYYKDTLKIKVVDKADAETGYVKLVEQSITTIACQPVDISQLITIVNSDCSPQFLANGEYVSSNYVSDKTGDYKIYAGYKGEGYLKFVDIVVCVNPIPQNTIHIYDIFGEEIDNEATFTLNEKTVYLSYEVEDITNQTINAIIGDTRYAIVENCSSPIIQIRLISVGTTTLTIIHNDASLTITINVV